jgi:tRNA G18 (ribose-2'-O)-methylase SpoU
VLQRPSNRNEYSTLPRHSLIVCASLVQNSANLGGLCRTVEAFRLQALVLPDLAIARSPNFKNLAASSHHWQPLQACSKEELPEWLWQQQQHNYSIVALTADLDAVPLPKFSFPQQTVLLLGQELTGIPSALLQRCEHRVTIPQFGLVESLNVHTAAAIAIYEYVKQQV